MCLPEKDLARLNSLPGASAPLLTHPENWLDHFKRNPCKERKKAVY